MRRGEIHVIRGRRNKNKGGESRARKHEIDQNRCSTMVIDVDKKRVKIKEKMVVNYFACGYSVSGRRR